MIDDKENDSDKLAQAKKEFDLCIDHERDNRKTALDDIKFARLGEQWPAEILEQRQNEHRPALTINKMPAFIRQVVNDSRQNKPAISVHPVDDDADVETAEVLSGIVRNIEQVSNADVAYDTAVEQAVTSGFGYWRVDIDYAYQDSFDLDLCIRRITNQFSVFGDPNSTSADSSDWDIAFVTDRMPLATFKRKYKGKANVDFESEGWQDCNDTEWLNDEGVLIAERWTREEVDKEIVKLSDGRVFSVDDLEANPELLDGIQTGGLEVVAQRTIKAKKVKQTIMTGAEILETVDHPGCYIPIVPVYGDEILVQGKRYFRSLIHSAKDAQRMVNYWRSTSTELIALAPRVPFIGEEGAFDVDNNWSKANTSSLPYLEYTKGSQMPQRQPLDTGSAAGALQEALNASDDMKAIIGMYDASMGARSNETSGKAIMARQREGDVATFHFIDNVSRAIRHTGRILVDLIPHVYSGERVMRVLGEDGKAKNVPINTPYQKPEDEQGNNMGTPEQNDGMSEQNEMQGMVMAMHDLSVGKYDVVVKAGPSFTTQREEAAAQMTQLLQAFPPAAPVIGPMLVKAMDWPGADDIAEKLEALANPQQPQIPPELQQQIEQGQQMIQQLQQENQQLKQDQQANTQEIQMKSQAKSMEISENIKLKREEFEAEMLLEREKFAKQMELERWKIEQQNGLKTIQMAVDTETKQISAMSKGQFNGSA